MTKAKTKSRRDVRWGVVGNCGLYTGQSLTRRAAIKKHTDAYRAPNETTDEVWHWCRSQGDRCVKLVITWTPPAKAKKRSAKR